MLDELRDLYQEVILDHSRNPRNCRHPDAANREAHGHNPMCGDTLVVYLTVGEDGVIRDAAFKGNGCAISVASASMMTEVVKGKSLEEAKRLFQSFQHMCTSEDYDADEQEDPDAAERLQVLAGVRAFPVRVKCATLAWHTLNAATKGENQISTE